MQLMTADAAVQGQVPNPSSDPNCLFCRFNDQTVNKIFAESSNFYARRDNFPAAEGHLEIVPKRHVVSFFELTQAEVSEAYHLMAEVRVRLTELYKPEGYTIGVNEGRAAGRSVDHLHIHLIPRHFGDVDDPRGGIRQILPNCDPGLWTTD
jgi:diadenosine tetraphosphate (Ap4A) HIT family hydrolase